MLTRQPRCSRPSITRAATPRHHLLQHVQLLPSRCSRPITTPAPLVLCASTRTTIPAHTSWLAGGGADRPPSPFHLLKLQEDGLANLGGAVRRRRYGGLVKEELDMNVDWNAVFKDPYRPLVVDVGCGAGRFVLLAALHGVVPGTKAAGLRFAGQPANFLGLDQHSQLMDRGNAWAAARGLSGHCHYLGVNARTSLQALLRTYPGPVALLAVQYPDPAYRVTRHVVTPEFVAACSCVLAPGAGVLLSSDVLSTAQHMKRCFGTCAGSIFAPSALHHTPGAVFHDDGIEVDPYLSRPILSNSTDSFVLHMDDGSASDATGSSSEPDDSEQQQQQQQQVAISVDDAHQQQQQPQQQEQQVSEDVWPGAGWLVANPLRVPTEREVFADLVTHSPVFRLLLVRT